MIGNVIDFREEFYVKAYRRWLVIYSLCKNQKFNSFPLKKAAFVDFLLCNPELLKLFLLKFGKAPQSLNLDEILYKNNIGHGLAQDYKDFSKSCVLLINHGFLGFEKKSGEVVLFPTEKLFPVELLISQRWEAQIAMLRPMLSKSINVLHNSVLGE